MGFLAKTPFLRLFAFLATGIVIGEFVGYSAGAVAALCLVGASAIAGSFTIKNAAANYKWRSLFGIGVFCFLTATGLFIQHRFSEQTRLNFSSEAAIYDVELTSNPIIKERSVMVYAQTHSRTDSVSTQPVAKKVILYIAKDSSATTLKRGDRLLISSSIAEPKTMGNPEEFDYGLYLRRQGTGGSGYVAADSWQIVGQKKGFSLIDMADNCRAYLLDIYRRMGLSGDEFGMLAALTLGYKDALTPELRESFSTTGAMHVLAVSGLHVGIIYAVFNWILSLLLRRTKRNERIKSALIIIFLWFYAFVTGLSPSVLRSTIMFSCMSLAGIIGRKSQTYNTIFLSAFLLLLYKPTLLFDVGFELSYSAVVAIVYFQPKIAGILAVKNRFLRWAWELTAVSLAAQIGTAPFSIFYFHQFPNYFLLSNFVVIPAATLILYGAVALFATSWIPLVGTAVAWLLNWTLKSMYFLITCIENLPHALSIVWINNWQLLLLYLAIIACGFCCYRLSFRNLAAILSLILAFFGLQTWHRYQNLTTDELIVFSHSKSLFVNRLTRNENLVIATDTTLCQRLAGDHWDKTEAAPPHFAGDSTLTSHAFTFNGESVLVLDQNHFRYKSAPSPIAVDYLIVGRGVYPADDFFDFVQPGTLITSGEVYGRNDTKFKTMCAAQGCEFHSVREEGAWRLTVSR